MSFKIYTKTGDKGETSLFGGARIPKFHDRIESYGTVDELNSWLGLIRDVVTDDSVRVTLKDIQDRLFVVGAHLASDPEKNMSTPDLTQEDIAQLEHEIDRMETVLPALKNFILPGGHQTVSYCHIARCVCRRAERNTVLLASNEPVAGVVVVYLNRLSDYLFVLGRFIAHNLQAEEIVWNSRR